MAHSTKKTDVYYLLIYFPETYKNQPEYQNMIESMEVIIDSKQKDITKKMESFLSTKADSINKFEYDN